MVQICEKLKTFKCSWNDIHGIREDYVCGIEEAVRLLHQLKRNALEQDKQERWLRNQENGALQDDKKDIGTNYPKTGILVDVSNTWPNTDRYFPCDENSLLSQSGISDGPFKINKAVLSHSKLPSWSEGVTSQLSDYHSRNPHSKSNEIDNYTSHSFDDHIQSNYSFLNKSNNPVSRYTSSSVIPDSWGDSWELMQPSLQSGTYYRSDSYMNCDLDGHRPGYNQTVPNIKETYSSQFGHMYPPHPIMPLGIPAFPYPLPHDFSIPPRQCQCRLCCENHLSILTNKYNHSKDSISNNFESNLRSAGRQDNTDICAPFAKMSLDNSNSKSRNFSINSPPYTSFQTINESPEVVLRPDAEKPQHKRGSYYDNVPSSLDDSICVVGSSLNSKCDFQPNGTIPNTSLTLAKPSRSQKGISVSDSAGTSQTLKLQKKSYSNASFTPTLDKVDTATSSNSDVKNVKSNQTVAVKDSKGGKKWACSSCTFYNAADKSICDMCGRSKHPGPEVTPLVSGGRECPQCTLVNKKDSENCTACGASLKDSPTYI